MRIIFSSCSWEDYLYWQQTDKEILKRINELVKNIQRTPFEGKGKPEPLKHNLAGFWSRRITEEHRLVYEVSGDNLLISACRYHY
ncbi:TPA: Txe/YoeB family addiction module toxin [Yersinia enterocolitica]|uniref:Txe/YoeB family addiction module toxin n=1 Tax=Yersinia enterocolitica TaxID=630 RepID=UPI00067B24E3|nr:Txe/YoeB family addiction module toxin [Yersinia enterocolitica]HDL6965195.1 Txe/YoeB family addiction module toxin [Yersinia enterocolitica]HDL6969525.1 Txe/YoeB family addiction module toxin [Yersinia enterocolitica]HDL6973695.1 Txe/YoeB family addiction module toxin [Yersinia enterocolitica]HDL6986044.1 Txe/YoeB family addiction module toxin [Yersinia enterocolitica]HDL6994573.1 Txe/YoeB family addiction module toxin [Yersinia enterocolitica]